MLYPVGTDHVSLEQIISSDPNLKKDKAGNYLERLEIREDYESYEKRVLNKLLHRHFGINGSEKIMNHISNLIMKDDPLQDSHLVNALKEKTFSIETNKAGEYVVRKSRNVNQKKIHNPIRTLMGHIQELRVLSQLVNLIEKGWGTAVFVRNIKTKKIPFEELQIDGVLELNSLTDMHRFYLPFQSKSGTGSSRANTLHNKFFNFFENSRVRNQLENDYRLFCKVQNFDKSTLVTTKSKLKMLCAQFSELERKSSTEVLQTIEDAFSLYFQNDGLVIMPVKGIMDLPLLEVFKSFLDQGKLKVRNKI